MGTCGACERFLHAVEMDAGVVVAKHGYTRNRWEGAGERGECFGSREAPHELSPEIARSVAEAWERRRDEFAERLRAIDAGEVTELRECGSSSSRVRPAGFEPGTHVRTDGLDAHGHPTHRVARVEIVVFHAGYVETLVRTPATCNVEGGNDWWPYYLKRHRESVEFEHRHLAERARHHRRRVDTWTLTELPPANAKSMAKSARNVARHVMPQAEPAR